MIQKDREGELKGREKSEPIGGGGGGPFTIRVGCLHTPINLSKDVYTCPVVVGVKYRAKGMRGEMASYDSLVVGREPTYLLFCRVRIDK